MDKIENRRITSEQETNMDRRIKTMMIQVRPKLLQISCQNQIRFPHPKKEAELTWNYGLLTRHFVISNGVGQYLR